MIAVTLLLNSFLKKCSGDGASQPPIFRPNGDQSPFNIKPSSFLYQNILLPLACIELCSLLDFFFFSDLFDEQSCRPLIFIKWLLMLKF